MAEWILLVMGWRVMFSFGFLVKNRIIPDKVVSVNVGASISAVNSSLLVSLLVGNHGHYGG